MGAQAHRTNLSEATIRAASSVAAVLEQRHADVTSRYYCVNSGTTGNIKCCKKTLKIIVLVLYWSHTDIFVGVEAFSIFAFSVSLSALELVVSKFT